MDGAASYEVEWRYRRFVGNVGDDVDADNNPGRVGEVLRWTNDENNSRVVNPGRATVADADSFVVKDVANNKQSSEYLLEFRVTALGDNGIREESGWVKWNISRFRAELVKSYKCQLLDRVGVAADVWEVWEAAALLFALHSGGLSAAILEATKAAAALPTVAKSAKLLEGCFERDAAQLIDALKDTSAFVDVYLTISGVDVVLERVLCGNSYLGTNFRDKNFEADDIDGLYEACAPTRR